MRDDVTWIVVAFVILIAELFTGTFYLLMVALAFVAAAAAAFLGFVLGVQLLVGALVGLVLVTILHRSRLGRQRSDVAAGVDPELGIDVGQPVEVGAWIDGVARVKYRGALWDAVPEHVNQPVTGALVIKAIEGSTLVLGARTTS